MASDTNTLMKVSKKGKSAAIFKVKATEAEIQKAMKREPMNLFVYLPIIKPILQPIKLESGINTSSIGPAKGLKRFERKFPIIIDTANFLSKVLMGFTISPTLNWLGR